MFKQMFLGVCAALGISGMLYSLVDYLVADKNRSTMVNKEKLNSLPKDATSTMPSNNLTSTSTEHLPSSQTNNNLTNSVNHKQNLNSNTITENNMMTKEAKDPLTQVVPSLQATNNSSMVIKNSNTLSPSNPPSSQFNQGNTPAAILNKIENNPSSNQTVNKQIPNNSIPTNTVNSNNSANISINNSAPVDNSNLPQIITTPAP